MLGVDVSKHTLAAAFVDPATRKLQWELTVPNTPAGILRLLGRTPVSAPWVLEPTGRYSLGVVQQARAADRTVLLAQPRKAKAFLSGLHPRAKTDRLDSQGLAVYGSCAELRPYPVKSEAMDQLDQLLTARRGITQALMQLRQRQAELPYAGVQLAPAIASLTAQQRELDRQIAAHAAALPAPALPAVPPVPVCTPAAAPSVPEPAATGAAVVPPPAPAPAFSLVAALDRVPGIGPVTAAALASCLAGKTFATPDAFVAYVGLDVRVRESGTLRGQRRLSKHGDAELRRLLYLCAQANLRRKDSPFLPQYEQERKKGLSSTAALCAVARKIAKLAWSMVRHQTEFDPNRLYAKPEKRKVPSATP